MFDTQPYLRCMYQTFFILSYYGLFRVGELASGSHPVRAKNVHVAMNKDKIRFILYTSKTHGLELKPQKIKISAVSSKSSVKNTKPNSIGHQFCPFQLSCEYLAIRGNYVNDLILSLFLGIIPQFCFLMSGPHSGK